MRDNLVWEGGREGVWSGREREGGIVWSGNEGGYGLGERVEKEEER